MNLRPLYQAVHGETANPTTEELKAIAETMAFLPDNIFNSVHKHYVCGETIEAIAAEMGVHTRLVDVWLQHGMNMMKLWSGVGDDVIMK